MAAESGHPSALPSELEEQLLDALERDDRKPCVERLCAQHPDFAVHMLQRLEDAEGFEARFERIPAQIGPYQILRRIGYGGMGTVYLARDEAADREVALKTLTPDSLAHPLARSRFEREIAIAMQLDHPNICTVFSAGEHDGAPYLTMRYLPGESLAGTIAGRKGAPCTSAQIDEFVHCIEKVARALHTAHELGLVHRDVKPQNILLDPDREPLLIDFGLAGDETGMHTCLTLTGERLGTPSYMSPEQVAGETARIDRRTDVYSCAVTLFEAVTGKTPFGGSTLSTVYGAITSTDLPKARRCNRGIPHELDAVLAVATDKDPRRRYATALAFAEDLARVRRRQPIAGRPPGLVLRSRRWVQRNPRVAALIAILGVTAVLAAALLASASRAVARTDLLSRRTVFDGLVQRARALPPPWPAHRADIDHWLGGWRALSGELDALRAEVHAMRSGTEWKDVTEFVGPELDAIVRRIERFAAQPRGAVRSVEAKSRWATSLAGRQDAWPAAQRQARERHGVALAPQAGLVPIGADAKSGLLEFYHLASSADDVPLPRAGAPMTEAQGMVFVLIPAGTFTMGAQAADPRAVHYDPDADPREGPPSRESVGAFFLSKYEMTQGQWYRLNSRFLLDGAPRPSRFRAGETVLGTEFTAAHPVEQVSWTAARTLLAHVGLALPTEEQWEYACRAHSHTPWYWGKAPRHDLANLGGAKGLGPYRRHAPVGSYPANSFGLHDMHGNVWEWCIRRRVVPDRLTARQPMRGGSYLNPHNGRASDVLDEGPEVAKGRYGVRPVRAIQ